MYRVSCDPTQTGCGMYEQKKKKSAYRNCCILPLLSCLQLYLLFLDSSSGYCYILYYYSSPQPHCDQYTSTGVYWAVDAIKRGIFKAESLNTTARIIATAIAATYSKTAELLWWLLVWIEDDDEQGDEMKKKKQKKK